MSVFAASYRCRCFQVSEGQMNTNFSEMNNTTSWVGTNISSFLVGMGIGALIGILFAPKAGNETREFLTQKAEDGRQYAQRKARELRDRANDIVDRGKDV